MKDVIADAVERILKDYCTPQVVRQIESGASGASLWRVLEDSGFPDALAATAVGGAGLSLADICPVLELCGRYAMPLPLGETLVARGLIAEAGGEPPRGSIIFGTGSIEAEARLRCPNVFGAQVADWILVSRNGNCRLLPSKSAAHQMACFGLSATIVWPIEAWSDAQPYMISVDIAVAQAAVYAVQLSGALMAVFERTLQFANERQQFGKTIGKFQAIQHQLSVMSEHVLAARMAAQIAMPQDGITFDRLKVAVAKARTSEAAAEVAALSHAIHGAIGFTREHDLQLLTRRLHAWRLAAGSESHWHDVVGEVLLADTCPRSLSLLRRLTDVG